VIVMVSNASGLDVGLLAAKYPGRIGHLYSPGGQRGPWRELPYALDNGAWPAFKNAAAWDEAGWLSLLRWSVMSGIAPEWALVPDCVGDRDETLRKWGEYVSVVIAHGFRPAFAVQDGMTFDDVPTDDCVLFLGGSTEWKEAAIAPWCRRYPGRVHVGRVNYWNRLLASFRAGAISVDGTGWFRRGRTAQSSQSNDLRKFLRETSSL
jgi:hypothetical protein